jgi:hypothetical protein
MVTVPPSFSSDENIAFPLPSALKMPATTSEFPLSSPVNSAIIGPMSCAFVHPLPNERCRYASHSVMFAGLVSGSLEMMISSCLLIT